MPDTPRRKSQVPPPELRPHPRSRASAGRQPPSDYSHPRAKDFASRQSHLSPELRHDSDPPSTVPRRPDHDEGTGRLDSHQKREDRQRDEVADHAAVDSDPPTSPKPPRSPLLNRSDVSFTDSPASSSEMGREQEDDKPSIELVPRTVRGAFESYNMDPHSWVPAQGLRQEMGTLKGLLKHSKGLGKELAGILKLAEQNGKVSQELMNDIYWIAESVAGKRAEELKRKAKQHQQEPPDVEEAPLVKSCRSLQDQIESRPDLYDYLFPENADFSASLAGRDWDGKTISGAESDALSNHDPYRKVLNGATFPTIHDPATETIFKYRRQELQRIVGLCEALGQGFGRREKIVQKEKHKRVRESAKQFQEIARRMMEDMERSPNARDLEEIQRLRLGMIKIAADCKVYMAQSKHEDRLMLCENMLDSLERLNLTDTAIVAEDEQSVWDRITNVTEAIMENLSPDQKQGFEETTQMLLFSDEALSNALDKIKGYQDIAKAAKEADLKSAVEKGEISEEEAKKSLAKFNETTFAEVTKISQGASSGLAVAGDLVTLFTKARDLMKSDVRTKKDILKTGEAFSKTVKNAASLTSTVSGDAFAAAGATGVGSGLGVATAVNGGWVTWKTHKRVRIIDSIEDQSPEALEVLGGIRSRARKKEVRSFLKAVGGTVAVVGGAVVIVGTGGLAAPVLAAVGAVLGSGLSGWKARNRIAKGAKGIRGQERQDLAEKTFKYMQELIKDGRYGEAQQLAKALTNNQIKSYQMLDGCMSEDGAKQEKAMTLIRDKLKTW